MAQMHWQLGEFLAMYGNIDLNIAQPQKVAQWDDRRQVVAFVLASDN